MKLFFAALALVLGFTPSAFAREKVRILMGFEESRQSAPRLLSPRQQANQSATMSRQLALHEGWIRAYAAFPKDAELVLTRQARAEDFAQAFFDPDTTAILWVGHGAVAPFSPDIASLFDRLPDSRGRDLLPVIRALRSIPGTDRKFFGIVTCHARTILARHQIATTGESLYATDGKVLAHRVMEDVVRAHERFLLSAEKSAPAAIENAIDGRAVQLDRGPGRMDWIVYAAGRPAGIWLAEQSSLKLTLTDSENSLTFQALDPGAAKKILERGEDPFESVHAEGWSVFANPRTGKPYGVLQRTYRRDSSARRPTSN